MLLDDQDRSLWDDARIEEGRAVLDRALPLRQPGPYQLQAAIASLHLEPETDWPQIAALYGRLASLAPSPVVELNRAVAVAMAEGPSAGLELIDGIDGLDGYRHLHSARGDLLRRLGRGDEAADGVRPRARAGAAARRARVPGAAAGRSTILGVSVEEKLYGCQSMTGALRRVLVRAPRAEDLRGWQKCGWRAEPDAAGIAREHEAFCSLLEDAGAEVVLAESSADGNPDAIYTYDPALVADEGALLLHPGKEMPARRGGRDGRGLRACRRPGRGPAERAGLGRGRRLLLARRAHAARRLRLPHERGRDRPPARAAARRRGASPSTSRTGTAATR